ncbi:putative phage tail protein [Vibrio mediterranei AK1]|uniref:tail fiber protein n=1 Tax=Vibrio mediterranei TaxID=689 RepID=UPI000154235A|nr:tail fiber protein [Vibrio mediterranei]EDL52609.1 putative phage tail protein [Vibrio mediterranei AK1]
MSLLITNAGIAASIRAGDLGISYKIAEISIGTEGYTPTKDQTTLRNEVQRKAITRGEVAELGQLHFETTWDGDEAFEGKELGYWLDDGTLFAVDSRNGEVITYKQQDSAVTEACELNLAASTIDNITVEVLNPYSATEERAGIAKIAKDSDVDLGTDDSRFLTVKKLLKRTASTIRSGVVQLSNSYSGTSESKVVTEKALSDGLADHSHGASDLPLASTSQKGVVQLTDSTTSSSSVLGATAKAVKTVKDLLTGHTNKFKTGRYSNNNVNNGWFSGNVGADNSIEYGYYYVWVTVTPSAITVNFELRLSGFSQVGSHDSGVNIDIKWSALSGAFSQAGVNGWSYSTRGSGIAISTTGTTDQTIMPFRIVPNGTDKKLSLYSPQLDFRDVNNGYPTINGMTLYGEVTLQNPKFI